MKLLIIIFSILFIFSSCREKDEKMKLVDLIIKNPDNIHKILYDTNYTTYDFIEVINKKHDYSTFLKDYIKKNFSSGYLVDFDSFNNFKKNTDFYGKEYGIEISSIIDSTKKIQMNLIYKNGYWKIDWIMTGNLSVFPSPL